MGDHLKILNLSHEAAEVSCGNFHCCARLMERKEKQVLRDEKKAMLGRPRKNRFNVHEVKCWGDGFSGRLGYEPRSGQDSDPDLFIGNTPNDMGELMIPAKILSDEQLKFGKFKDGEVVHVAGGHAHTCAVVRAGKNGDEADCVSCWGRKTRISDDWEAEKGWASSPLSLLGDVTQHRGCYPIFGKSKVAALAVGYFHNCVVLDDKEDDSRAGRVWCWGSPGMSEDPSTMGKNLGGQTLATIPSGGAVSTDIKFSRKGCIENKDNMDERRLEYKVSPKLSYNSPKACAAECSKYGFHFAAVQNGDECFCSSRDKDDPDVYKRDQKECTDAEDTDCQKACAGDGSLDCGGRNRACVYDITGGVEALTSPLKEKPGNSSEYIAGVDGDWANAGWAIPAKVGKKRLIAAGRDFTCVIHDKDESKDEDAAGSEVAAGDSLTCWGDVFRQLDEEGLQHTVTSHSFQGEVTALGAGFCRVCAAELKDETSKLHCWEWSSTQCENVDVWDPGNLQYLEEKKLTIDIQGGRKVTQIGIGTWHACLVLDGREVVCLGGSDQGQLGRGSTSPDRLEDKIQDPLVVTRASAVDLGIDPRIYDELEEWSRLYLAIVVVAGVMLVIMCCYQPCFRLAKTAFTVVHKTSCSRCTSLSKKWSKGNGSLMFVKRKRGIREELGFEESAAIA
ncbi:unnamed protein product [Chrysoparadoxa australica]